MLALPHLMHNYNYTRRVDSEKCSQDLRQYKSICVLNCKCKAGETLSPGAEVDQ